MNDGPSALADPAEDTALTRPFPGASPYEEYVHASVLNTLQQPLTEAADEMGFLVTTQVMELWFTLIVHEWRTAREALVKDDLPAALDALVRSRRALSALNDSWQPIAALTPLQFEGFRAAFGRASGFQSAMYRHIEFLLGEKSQSLVNAHRGDPAVHEALRDAHREPSLYDEVLCFLHRQGLPVAGARPRTRRLPLVHLRPGRGGAVARRLRRIAVRGTGPARGGADRHRRAGRPLAVRPPDGGAPGHGGQARQWGHRRSGLPGAARPACGLPRAVGGTRCALGSSPRSRRRRRSVS